MLFIFLVFANVGGKLQLLEGSSRGLGVSQQCKAGDKIFSLPWHAALTPASCIHLLIRDEAKRQGEILVDSIAQCKLLE